MFTASSSSGGSVTLTAAEVNSGLTLTSNYTGSDHPVNTLTITASETVGQHTLTSAAQSIVVTDPAATTSAASTGSNPLTLHVSGDLYNGDPQIEVFVDGTQVGSAAYNVTADHSLGQTQTITIAGNFDPLVAHQVQVKFTNDAWDGTSTADGHDRNVYVDSITLNGATVDGSQGTNGATNGAVKASNPNTAVMDINGTLALNVAADPPPPPQPAAASGNPLTLHVSGDLYNGDPQIAVFVDGTQVGSGTYNVTADHSLGQTQTITIAGNFDPSVAHQVQVKFTNDAWDGTSTADGHDRNVYVELDHAERRDGRRQPGHERRDQRRGHGLEPAHGRDGHQRHAHPQRGRRSAGNHEWQRHHERQRQQRRPAAAAAVPERARSWLARAQGRRRQGRVTMSRRPAATATPARSLRRSPRWRARSRPWRTARSRPHMSRAAPTISPARSS